MTAHEVIAVRYATRGTRKSEVYHEYAAYGEPDAEIAMDYFFWVIRSAMETILVDTGYDLAAGERRGRTCLCPPLEALDRIGIARDSVDRILLTHLHYDHTGNVNAFPGAELLVHSRELDFWTGPYARRRLFAAVAEPDEIALIESAKSAGRVRLLGDDEEIAKGVRSIRVGGHSPGQLVTVVDTAEGTAVLASDAIHYYEELERDWPFNIIWNLQEMYEGYDLLHELARAPGAALVAGHDPAVLERFAPLSQETAGLAVRVP
jgi:glyoxylase-like metal-dependent hydrolase (beta-lactamase superfamily II)